jgi:Fur family peroxide stress response transcriptional regulator
MKIITNMEKLKNILETNGLKPTFQRLTVLEYLQQHECQHPTAEMIYEALIERIPTISITTIYNTLSAFLEKKIISAETITGTEIRYDFAPVPHHHFLCRECNKIYDVDIQCPLGNDTQNSVEGHTIHEIHGYFKGVCRECNKSKDKQKN